MTIRRMNVWLAGVVVLVGSLCLQATAQEGKHEVWGKNVPDWTVDVAGWTPVAAGEHPRLVFRKADLAAIQKRAATPEGKAIVARLEKLLGEKFTLWHPAGNGMMFQLTGDRRYSEKAKEQTLDVLDKKVKDARDGRYGFYNGGGAMRIGPAIWAMALAYDLNYDGWDEALRTKVAAAIQDHPDTAKISEKGPIQPSCNHFGAAVGGVATGLLAIRGDAGTDSGKVDAMLRQAVKQLRDEITLGYGDRGYYFEGHQCGRISSNTGLIPFLQHYRVAAGKDMVSKNENARWLAAKWVHEFALNPDGKYVNPQRGMYARNFPRGGMWSENGDFSQGFGICPPEFVPALKWVYNNQVEPKDKTYDVLDYPGQAIYALVNWPIDVQEKNPQEQPDLFPRVMHDKAAGYVIFRNGWSAEGKDVCVSALVGTHPTHTNGRAMAMGGSVYVYGKGLGKGLEWPSAAGQRLPGVFHCSYPTYTKFEADGSGVVSAKRYPGMRAMKGPGAGSPDWAEAEKTPTSLAVDFSGASGAELLVAMAGPQVGWTVNQWLDNVSPAKFADLQGQDGYVAKVIELKIGGQKGFVMTLQKGTAPQAQQEGEGVRVGGRLVTFDGEKIVLGK